MADFLAFDEGKSELAASGLPATCRFLLSTKSVDGTSAFAAGNTLSGGQMAEITGTGYARQSQAEPAPAAGVVAFAAMTWSTVAAVDWPATVRSVVLVTSADNSGKAICAWNLQPGGVARDLSQANLQEIVTPTLQVG